MGHEQLNLTLPIQSALSADDFLVGESNGLAFEVILTWPDWPMPVVLLSGPEGSGKSHLAHIWLQNSQAQQLDDLDREFLSQNASMRPLLLEDIDRTEVDETALFDLINDCMLTKRSLLMTSRSGAKDLLFEKPDLISRLKLAVPAMIQEPDEGLITQLITKLFSDRQIQVSEKVNHYLLMRMDRSFKEAGRIVDALDQLSLSEKKSISIAMAAKVLTRDHETVTSVL